MNSAIIKVIEGPEVCVSEVGGRITVVLPQHGGFSNMPTG